MKTVRARVLATTFLAGTIIFAGPANAQEQSAATDASATPPATADAPAAADVAAPSQAAPAQEIVVTGTRIPQPNLTSASPVVAVTSQEIKLQGTTRTEDLINSLPQALSAQGSNVSNGATGTATVDLRGMGPSRTMVLVNGRRLMPGDPNVPDPDINFVPAPLIKRVEVLTGGASSVYGADAVAGVVNFIMDTNFRGLRLDAQASTFMHYNDMDEGLKAANAARGFRPPHGWSTNGGAQDVAAAFGASFDDNRGSLMAYATYRKQDAVLEATRDYSFCATAALRESNAGANNDAGELGRLFNCGGSGTSANGTFARVNGGGGSFTVSANRTFVASNATTNPPFNFAPFNYFQRPDERYTAGAFAQYEISEGAKPYFEAMFMDDRSVSAVAPSGIFGTVININCDNPLLSAQQVATMCIPANTFVDANGVTRASVVIARRNVEGGPRLDDQQHTAYRLVGGVKGELLTGVSYDAYYQYGTTIYADTFLNDVSLTKILKALDVVTDPANGQPTCRSTLAGTDANCIPLDLFTIGGVTQAAVDYISTPGFQRGDTRERIANVNFTLEGGALGLQTPWSDRGIGLNVGGEYRKESLVLRVDDAFRTGDLQGQGGPIPPTDGHFDVRELFGEVQIPIISHSLFEELSLNAGYRYSDYKVAGSHFSTDTYKVGAEFAPIRDVRFRASYNRAVRAPNIVELFTPQSVSLDGSADPCAGAIDPATGNVEGGATLDQCKLTGVTAAQYGNILDTPGGQYNALQGGNPNLKPEVADSYTFGVVVQPRFIPGLSFSADYFDIKLKKAIGTLGFNVIMNQCLATGDPTFCSRIKRQAVTGSLWLFVDNVANGGYIVDINDNLGGIATKGIDLQGSYNHRIGGLGTLNLSLVGTYLKHATFPYDCAGFYGDSCGLPRPKWRHKFRAGFTLPNGLGLSAQWRHLSSVRNDVLSDDPDIGNTNMAPTDHFPGNDKIKAQDYLDLTFTARVADRFNFRLGANNIFDREPPIVGNTTPVGGSGPGGAPSSPPFGNGNTYPQVYDALGRFLFAGVTVDF